MQQIVSQIKKRERLDVTTHQHPHCRCDVTTFSNSTLLPPALTVFPNPILYRSFKIAASLIHIGTRRNGMREARKAGEMKEREKQISEELQ